VTGGAYGVGHRMPIKATRALLTAALNGELKKVETRMIRTFGFAVRLPSKRWTAAILDPRSTLADGEEYDAQAKK